MTASYHPVIGLEIHVQLNSKTKLFCRCSTDYIGAVPNTNICPRCTGQVGSLPVMNEAVVRMGVRGGLALNCHINLVTRFDRKNYFYADLPKAYQISEFYLPLAEHGTLTITDDDGNLKKVGITRLHLEEDAGKLVHGGSDGRIVSSTQSFVDFNRSGVPLAEIVSDPDLRSPGEAKRYVMAIRRLVRYLGISDGDMERGSMRCDANISVKFDDGRWSSRTEVKNMNSLKAIESALAYEIQRHIALVESGRHVTAETRNWDDANRVTSASRSKEEANDYRYFPEPDLPPLVLTQDFVDQQARSLPELPDARYQRYLSQYGLPAEDVDVLYESRELGDYFEEIVAAGASPRKASNWILNDVLRLVTGDFSAEKRPMSPERLAGLIKLNEDGKISTTQAKELFEVMIAKNMTAEEAAKATNQRIGAVEGSELGQIVEKVLAANADVLEVIRSGQDKKDKKRKFLQGLIMREVKGQASPQEVSALLDEKIG
ncbi:Asp-tRNA(Asn)/Glu-tRNA(Gln) amidotransferase subunit GatB [Jonquetella anthropi]|uniref:Asp-tRNA(Asn)/Glu-tRNA(Gln) amidotransferase subunit GatB n=1 Tax=Jonquetella anthropi TaxID=428712 RepID=UPI0001B91259|nr:Asp-tRNA(Asn)/Glu-tRNA(Gln) amidotransferase subunit GatB [Jonquetella anthropi]EEX48368.1 aspartyl/glutamyl-tRNA(Asn/Gln) amidotransferase, B subunit [Jonquetella anthropi E3_33 E1]